MVTITVDPSWIFQINEIIRVLRSLLRVLFQWGEIITAVATVIISFMLMRLYKRQQEQLAANHASILDISSVDWERDEGTIYISNYGNGAVKDLRLVTLMYVDNGAHRDYSSMPRRLKNQKSRGKWTSVIQDGKEDVPFTAESRIGVPAPSNFSRRWIGIRFSNFLRKLKEEGATEVKYRHFILGKELGNERVVIPLPPAPRSVDLTTFDHSHSLESFDSVDNIPNYVERGFDQTFSHYYQLSRSRKKGRRIYSKGIRLINIIPKITLHPRPLDLMGLKRVKRTILKQKIRDLYKNEGNRQNILVVKDDNQEDTEKDQ